MRVFLCTAPSANNLAIPDSRVWINNLAGGLRALDVEILFPTFDTQRFFQECTSSLPGVEARNARATYSSLLYDEVKEAHYKQPVDALVAYVWNWHLTPEAVRHIHDLGIVTVLFYCNAAHQFHLVSDIAPYFDYCMVPEKQALPKYRAVGANPVRVQMAADPEMYKPSNQPAKYGVTFVGQSYLNRAEYVGYLIWHGVNVCVWGVGWPSREQLAQYPMARRIRSRLGDARRFIQRQLNLEPSWYPVPIRCCGGIISDEEMVEIYSRSRVSLNFSEVKDEVTGEIKRHIRLRDFEIPMSGGLLLTGYQEELTEFYEIGSEIVCYDTKEELLEKVQYLLQHPDEAEAIRRAGFARARAEHTWENRFRRFFYEIGLLKKAGQ